MKLYQLYYKLLSTTDKNEFIKTLRKNRKGKTTMSALIENPYTYSEIQDMFEKQRDKVPFEVIKDVTDNDGIKWRLKIAGNSIKDNFLNVMDIWNDDYILYFDGDTTGRGYGHGQNRFTNIDEFRKHIIDSFHLEERQQISMFD